jgi:hypothetical protein
MVQHSKPQPSSVYWLKNKINIKNNHIGNFHCHICINVGGN